MGNEIANEVNNSDAGLDSARPSLFEGFRTAQQYQQTADLVTQNKLPNIQLYDGDIDSGPGRTINNGSTDNDAKDGNSTPPSNSSFDQEMNTSLAEKVSKNKGGNDKSLSVNANDRSSANDGDMNSSLAEKAPTPHFPRNFRPIDLVIPPRPMPVIRSNRPARAAQ